MHMCPMVTPGTPPVPHVGGPVVGPGCPTVLIGGMPAATMGDMCTCVGPPDSIVLGSTGVLIGGKPAARMGDQCAHGGKITIGCPTVLIGETGGGGGGGSGGGGGGGLAAMPLPVLKQLLETVEGELAQVVAQIIALLEAAEHGVPLIEKCK